MLRACSLFERLARLAAGCSAIFLYALLFLVVMEIVVGGLLRLELRYNYEMAAYLLGAVLMLGMPQAFVSNTHIRITLLLGILSHAAQRWLDIITTGLAVGVSGYLAQALTTLAYQSYLDDTRSFLPSEMALAWPQGILAVAAWLLVLTVVARLLRLLLAPKTILQPEADLRTDR